MTLLADCRELKTRGLLSPQQLQEYEASLSSATSPPDAIRERVSALLIEEADAIVERVRMQSNEQEQETIGNSELAAVAVGGALGALNAWLRPAPAPMTTDKATTLWASAYDGAMATLNVAKRKRRVQQLQLKLLSGDVATCSHIVLCINGFMTQSDDPTHNWRVWIQEDQNAAVFAVQWEAGDAAAWNEFCTHVNHNIGSSSVSAMVAHFTGNPWHSAQGKAEQVGILLAHVLAARPVLLRGRKISMLGHSLGGAVIYSTFQEMTKLRAEKKGDGLPQITNAVSFAGAFIPDTQGLDNITNALDPNGGKFINVFSARDGVLSKLFWALQLPGPNNPAAAGCQAVAFAAAAAASCVNVDVSDLVIPRMENHFGHGYQQFMEAIKSRVVPHLFRT
ncbi:Alpha/Beta hydrolase fold [Phytophthora cactorum]|nr:Alpha/Beta hydrolase fold [Phytophthora cactorum]